MNNQKEHINSAKEGHQKGFNALLENHWDYVYNYLLKLTHNNYLSEEICIQTFAKAFDKIETYDDNYEFKTWLITICKRLWIDHQRKKEVETTKIDKKTTVIKSEDANIDEQLIQKQYVSNIKAVMKSLKPTDQEVLKKRLFEEKSYAEIADEMNESVNAIKVKLLRAKRKVAKILKTK
ncbi:RNA polymerase sigma factor [Psychroflexus sp. MBR-150]